MANNFKIPHKYFHNIRNTSITHFMLKLKQFALAKLARSRIYLSQSKRRTQIARKVGLDVRQIVLKNIIYF